MLLGVPAVTLAVWALASGVLRRWAGTGARTAVSGWVAAATLIGLAWVCLAWLNIRVDAFLQGDA